MEAGLRAEQVMLSVLAVSDATDDSVLKIHSAWLETDAIVCFVYESEHQPHGRVGLRRTIEQGPEWTPDGIASEILACEMGEPLGACLDQLEADQDGVLWWSGNLPEWKDPR